MDLLQEMNQVIAYIEENLTGMSLSEYIRRRRLSQAVFDLQNSNEKIVDIAPFWQVGVYHFQSENGKTKAIIGAQYRGTKLENMAVETIPAATWAVFSMNSPTGIDYVPAAYTRILTEWLPSSGYSRDVSIPSLEVFPPGNAGSADYTWEIWMPVLPRN